MKLYIWLAGGALALTTTACGGGSSSQTPAQQTTPTPMATISTPTPAPTTAPSATPTAAPTVMPAPLVASPNAITFASNVPVSFTATQSNYTGAFSETDTCSPQSGTIATIVAGATTGSYSVTPIAPGLCTITVTGGPGSSVSVPVTVSAAAITVQ